MRENWKGVGDSFIRERSKEEKTEGEGERRCCLWWVSVSPTSAFLKKLKKYIRHVTHFYFIFFIQDYQEITVSSTKLYLKNIFK